MQRRIFKKICIMRIAELKTAWKASLEEMANFVKCCYEGSVDEKKWAKTFYGDSRPSLGLTRIRSFIATAKSIKNVGYLTPLAYSYLLEGSTIIIRGVKMSLAGSLPRITRKYLIDDGRHRLATLLALGVKKTPVMIIKVIESKQERLDLFEKDVLQGIESFKESTEWKRYQEKKVID